MKNLLTKNWLLFILAFLVSYILMVGKSLYHSYQLFGELTYSQFLSISGQTFQLFFMPFLLLPFVFIYIAPAIIIISFIAYYFSVYKKINLNKAFIPKFKFLFFLIILLFWYNVSEFFYNAMMSA